MECDFPMANVIVKVRSLNIPLTVGLFTFRASWEMEMMGHSVVRQSFDFCRKVLQCFTNYLGAIFNCIRKTCFLCLLLVLQPLYSYFARPPEPSVVFFFLHLPWPLLTQQQNHRHSSDFDRSHSIIRCSLEL